MHIHTHKQPCIRSLAHSHFQCSELKAQGFLVHTISLELQEHQTRNPHLKHKLPREHLSVFPSALLLRIVFKCGSPHVSRMLFTSSYSSFPLAINTRPTDYKVNLFRTQSKCITYLIPSLIHWCLASRKICCNRCNWGLEQNN